MNTRKAIAAAIAAFTLVTGLACGPDVEPGVGTEPGHDPEPDKRQTTAPARANCPDIEFRADYERCLTIQTFVESRLGPYDVYIDIKGGNGVYPPHVPIAAGGWKHSLVYRAGVEMTLKVTLRYEGEESKDGFCSITDGGELYKTKLKSIRAGGGSPYEAVCALTTSQK
jgi:hypothetical protein